MKGTKTQVLLRAIEPEDIDLIYKWENDEINWHLSNTIVPFSRYILTKYIESAHLDIYQAKQLRLMIDINRNNNLVETVGTIDLFDFDPFHLRAGIGILISETVNRGKGYADLALKELINYAFSILQLNQLFCNIETNNKSSLNLFHKHGFVDIGVEKMWSKTVNGFKDELMLQLINPSHL